MKTTERQSTKRKDQHHRVPLEVTVPQLCVRKHLTPCELKKMENLSKEKRKIQGE